MTPLEKAKQHLEEAQRALDTWKTGSVPAHGANASIAQIFDQADRLFEIAHQHPELAAEAAAIGRAYGELGKTFQKK